MKYLFVALLVIPLFLQAQWTTSSGTNKFDGNYRAASIVGKGGKRLYAYPTLVLRKFEDDWPSLYITNIGYTGCSDDMIYFKFNDSDEIYVSKTLNTNADKDALFIISFDNIAMSEIMELLKSKSKVYIRYSNNCGENDYEFSLSGSTRAIDYVVGDFYANELLKINEDLKRKETKEKRYNDNIKKIDTVFYCGNSEKVGFRAKVLFNIDVVVINEQNYPKKTKLLQDYAITFYNQWRPNQILVSIEDDKNNFGEYYIAKSQVDRLIEYLDEEKTIKYIGDNWLSLMPVCNK